MKHPIIILHGWKLRGNTYQTLIDILRKGGYQVFSPDLPGFGSQPLRKQTRDRLLDMRVSENENVSLTLDDYVAFVDEFIKKNQLHKVILVGHSFGGRVAIKYSYQHPEKVYTMILSGVPIIRRLSLFQKIASFIAIIGKKTSFLLPEFILGFLRKSLYYSIGEFDYYHAGPMRNTFRNIIDEDMSLYIAKITAPIVLIWGEHDMHVPISHIEKIKRLNPSIQSIIIPKASHTPLRDNDKEFFQAIKQFL